MAKISPKKIKKEIIDEVALENNFAKMDIALIYKAILLKIREKCRDLEDGENFTLVGFANFKAMNRKERMARNPKTKEEYQVPSAKNIKIKVTGSFHDFVNGIDSIPEEEDEADV